MMVCICIALDDGMSFWRKKNNASFVILNLVTYSLLGFGLGYIIWDVKSELKSVVLFKSPSAIGAFIAS